MEDYEFLKSNEECIKFVGRNQYETLSKDNRIWWQHTFNDFEQLYETPFHQKPDYIESTFPEAYVETLYSIGYEVKDDIDKEALVQATIKSIISSRESLLLPQIPKKVRKKFNEVIIPYSNPYLDFVGKLPPDASVWHPKPPPSLKEMPIIQRSSVLEKKIAATFNDKFNSMTPSVSEVNEDVILSIFELLLRYPIREALRIRTEILGAVEDITAKYLGFPNYSKVECACDEIRKDIKASKQQSLSIAFQRNLPAELRRTQVKENLQEKWFEFHIKNQEVDTFANVWKDIIDLETTRKFCLWLLEHPELNPPEYLRTSGMLLRTTLDKPVYLGDMEIEDYDCEFNVKAILEKANIKGLSTSRKPSKVVEPVKSLSGDDISTINIIV